MLEHVHHNTNTSTNHKTVVAVASGVFMSMNRLIVIKFPTWSYNLTDIPLLRVRGRQSTMDCSMC